MNRKTVATLVTSEQNAEPYRKCGNDQFKGIPVMLTVVNSNHTCRSCHFRTHRRWIRSRARSQERDASDRQRPRTDEMEIIKSWLKKSPFLREW